MNSGTDWAAVISAASAFLALLFSFLQWGLSERRSQARDKRDHFIEAVKSPMEMHIDRLSDLQIDIFRWAGAEAETDFSIIFERMVRYLRDLNREINHLKDGEFGDCYDWFSIGTDEIAESVDEVAWETRQLHVRTFSTNLKRLFIKLDDAVAACRPRTKRRSKAS